MTPAEQLVIERIVKLEIEQSTLKESFTNLKSDIDDRFEKLEITLKDNHDETKKALTELKDTLTMGKGIYKFIGIVAAAIIFVLGLLKYLKP